MQQAIIREVVAMDRHGQEQLVVRWEGPNNKKSAYLSLRGYFDSYFGGKDNWKLGFVYER
ncbi:MAG: hypothetical protein CMF39_06400 [Legionellaceae bacterium]|nr:hypothetical protein [Legionellaceae bacterium]|tara:strand:- start:497 stop:676 length:180 start_codon:yes stop_codon:yes gene_type:complete